MFLYSNFNEFALKFYSENGKPADENAFRVKSYICMF